MSGSARSRPPRAKAHADHAKERAAAQTRHPDFEALAKSWNRKAPEDTRGVPGLESGFRAKVTAFIKAMEAAGLKVHIVGAARTRERAYLMRCAYLIYDGKYDVVVSELAQKPGAIDIDWEEIRESAGDEQGFKDFAVLLAGRLGIGLDLSKAPSLHSNHIKGLAVDMVIDGWKGATVEVADVNGNKIPTKGVEDLGKVGDTYDVHHFPTSGEPYHWSVDSH